MKPTQLPQNIREHHLEWNDRLQDWLDDDSEAGERAGFEKHLGDCTICQRRLADLQQLESALSAATPRPELDEAFDTRLFAQIESIDDAQRAVARQRIEQELQQNLHALSRSWRRTLAYLIPGIIGGIALAFALTSYFDASGLTGRLAAEGASELGGNASMIYLMLTTLMGASIGGVMATWLSRVAE